MTAPDADPGPVDLPALAGALLEKAAGAHARRAAHTLAHPVEGLRQTVIALLASVDLGEHESPGAASLQVLRGRVRVVTRHGSSSLREGALAPLPMRRHSLHADEDSVVLLSVAMGS
jgi:quercetin dioxygenase-like cupin family protein